MTKNLTLLFLFSVSAFFLFGQNEPLISFTKSQGVFTLVENGRAIPIVTDKNDYEVIHIAASCFQKDVQMVTGIAPPLYNTVREDEVLIVGSLDKCSFIQKFISEGKMSSIQIIGQWEKYQLSIVTKPYPGVRRAYVISGSDRRGAAYGLLDLSRQMGVSPWYWWADVPVRKEQSLYLGKKTYVSPSPDIQYRGIFINDEQWGLGMWAEKTFEKEVGALGPKTYAKVFELMLRLKSNYLWPSMNQKKAFYQVPGNKELADKYAIVMGSSTHEPMHLNPLLEWSAPGSGDWNYLTNKAKISAAWENRVKEVADYENIFTLGIRRKDERDEQGNIISVSQKSALQDVIGDQRLLLSKATGNSMNQIPQILPAYKEVMNQYNAGLVLPEDITLVWPDDNYGYISQLGGDKEAKRSGGTGLYYHLNYMGRPQAYVWLSSVHPMLIWEELNKAFVNGTRKLWVFNVGDIKPHEQQIQYCMDLAWKFPVGTPDEALRRVKDWYVQYLGENIGNQIYAVFTEYYKLAFQRKPEFMGWDRIEPVTPVVCTEFNYHYFQELNQRLAAYEDLFNKVQYLQTQIPQEYKSSYFQLVYYPIAGSYFMNKKMLYAQINKIYAKQRRVQTNSYAIKSKLAFEGIKHITTQYLKIEKGKWNEIMTWSSFDYSQMPPVDSIVILDKALFGLDYEGSDNGLSFQSLRALPVLSNLFKVPSYFEVYNKGKKPFKWSAKIDKEWIKLSKQGGECIEQDKINVDIDWSKAPIGKSYGKIDISALDSVFSLFVQINNVSTKELSKLNNLYVENNGYVSIKASNYDRKIDKAPFHWGVIDQLGLTGSSITVFSDTLKGINQKWDFKNNIASLEYDFYAFSSGWLTIFSQTLPTHQLSLQRACVYGISIDNQEPKLIDFSTRDRSEEWKQNVQRNSSIKDSKHFIASPGKHTLKVWMVEPGVVFDKFTLNFGGVTKAYLGMPNTKFVLK